MSAPLNISTLQYAVSTPIYEGPLDLLLRLIERAELDITRLALAQVTDQYLEHMRHLPQIPPEEVSAFLVIAAKLLQIKSQALLPQTSQFPAEEEDAGETLARQLRIYKRFKELASWLAQREAQGWRTYPRLVPPPRLEAKPDLYGISLEQLREIATQLLRPKVSLQSLEAAIPPPSVTLKQKVLHIVSYLRHHGRGVFNDLFTEGAPRVEVVVAFLALLELVKQHIIRAHQEDLFTPIIMEPAEAWEQPLALDLEFGE